MRKRTVLSAFCFVCLACLFSLLTFAWQKPQEAAAETLEQKTARMTASDRFSFRSAEGRMTEADIAAYAASAYDAQSTLFGSTVEYQPDTRRMFLLGDDPIVQIIPREYFVEGKEHLYIGDEYGFFIKPQYRTDLSQPLHSTVLLFDIVQEITLQEHGTIVLSVYPILERNYVYYFGGTQGVFFMNGISDAVVPVVDPNNGTYHSVDAFDLKNISFEAFLLNENECNYGIDYEYDKTKDDGCFFVGTHYYYKGYYNEDAGMSGGEAATEMIMFAAGFIPEIGPLISTGYTFGSIAGSYTNKNIVNTDNISIQPIFYPNTKSDQLSHGELVKYTCITSNTHGFLLKPQDNIFTESKYNENIQFARGVFQISRTADWRARFAAGLHIEVVDKQGQLLAQQDHLRGATILGDGPKNEVIPDAADKDLPDTDVRTLPGGKQSVSFTPAYKGTYSLTAAPVKVFDKNDPQRDVYGLPMPIDPSLASVRITGHGYDLLDGMVFSADAGDEHVFEISFDNSDHYGHIRVDVTITELSLNAPLSVAFTAQKQTALKIKPKETQIYMLTVENQNLSVEIRTGDGVPLAASQKGYTYAHLDATLLYYAVVTNATSQDIVTSVGLRLPPEKDLFSETALSAAVRPEYIRFTLPHAGTYGITFAEAADDAPTLALDTTLYVVGEKRTISTVNYNDLHAKTINFSVKEPTVVDLFYQLADTRTVLLNCLLVEKTDAPEWIIVKADGQRIENASYYFAKRGEQFRVLIRENDTETSIPIHFTQESADNWTFNRGTGTFHVKPTAILLNASAVLKPQLLYYTKDNIVKTLDIYPLHAIESLTITAATDTEGPYGVDLTLDAPIQAREEVWANLSIELPNGTIHAYPAVKIGAGVTNLPLASFIDSRYSGVENCKVRLTDLRYKRYQPNGVLDFEVIVYNDKTLSPGILFNDQKLNVPDRLVNPKFSSGTGLGTDPFIVKNERHFRNMDHSIAQLSRWYTLGASIHLYDTKSIVHDFRGRLNGNYHTIYPTISGTTETEIGLFGSVMGTVQNLYLSPSYEIGSNVTLVGGLAAQSTNAEFTNCTVLSEKRFFGHDISSQEETSSPITIGGLVGDALRSEFRFCTSQAEIISYFRDCTIGGLIGYMQDCIVYDCILENTIFYNSRSYAAGSAVVGGIAGHSEGSNHDFGLGDDDIVINPDGSWTAIGVDISDTIVKSRIVDHHARRNDDTDNGNALCPYVGKFVGKCDTKLFFVFGYGSSPGPWRGTLESGELHVATWKTGWWIFAKEHSFDQLQHYGGACGVGEIGFAYYEG